MCSGDASVANSTVTACVMAIEGDGIGASSSLPSQSPESWGVTSFAEADSLRDLLDAVQPVARVLIAAVVSRATKHDVPRRAIHR